ncbi:MAG: lysophospholipid acyltransferase family protein [Janthinobacterium lividum]
MVVDLRRLRHALEYAGFRAVGLLFRGLGLQTASRVSGAVWRRVAPYSKRHARALGHVAAAMPDKSETEREIIVRSMWEGLGRTFAEAFFLREIVAGDRIAYDDRRALDAWLAWPGGKVACSAHLANWELAVAPALATDLKLWSIYQRLKNPLVDEAVRKLRGFLYRGGLVAKDEGVPRQFLRIVRDGGAVAVLADLRDFTGISVPFLGRPAPTTTFPALLAVSAGSPILVCCMRRLPDVRFQQSFHLITMPDSGDRKADIATVTTAIQAVLDRYIRDWPDQWMWAHRRWG